MATATDIDAPLTLELDGDDLTPELFLRGARSFFALIQEVTDSVDESVAWRIQVKTGSNLVGVWPRQLSSSIAVSRIVSSIEAGLGAIEREPVEPPDFAERGLTSARDLARLGLASDGEIRVRVWTHKTPHNVTAQTITHVDAVLAGEFHEAGAIDGRIQTVSERGGAKFVVYDWFTDQPVRCIIPPSMLDKAIGAFGQRAEVFGEVYFDREGRARRIKVDDLAIFPPDASLPRADEVRGLMSNQPR